jgi:hypothetical protein
MRFSVREQYVFFVSRNGFRIPSEPQWTMELVFHDTNYRYFDASGLQHFCRPPHLSGGTIYHYHSR